MRTEWFVDNDPFCQAVLRKHWPSTPIYGDIKEVGAHNLAPVDLLCGGFPCQDLSVAGRGAGLGGARSGLWSEFARLIGELRPSYVVVENVPVLRSRGLGRILGEMAELGYDAEWNVISAADAGAPHLRKRIWIVAYPQRGELREQPRRRRGQDGTSAALASVDGEAQSLADAEREGLERFGREPWLAPLTEPRHDGSQDVGHAHVLGRNGWARDESSPYGWREPQDSGWWATEPDVGRVANGIPARVDRLRSLGNALVPQIAEEIGRRIMQYEGL